MSATRCLREEHTMILAMLDHFEIALKKAERSGSFDRSDGQNFLAFFRGFADGVHHLKEEERLFPILEEFGFPVDEGIIALMLEEHEAGRGMLREFEEALLGASRGIPGELEALSAAGRSFLYMLRDHIEKEEQGLFPMVDAALNGEALDRLECAYRAAENLPAYRDLYSGSLAAFRTLSARYPQLTAAAARK